MTVMSQTISSVTFKQAPNIFHRSFLVKFQPVVFSWILLFCWNENLRNTKTIVLCQHFFTKSHFLFRCKSGKYSDNCFGQCLWIKSFILVNFLCACVKGFVCWNEMLPIALINFRHQTLAVLLLLNCPKTKQQKNPSVRKLRLVLS